MMKFRCPDSVTGVCAETRCGGYLVNPRQEGVDDDMNPIYMAACVFDGSLRYFYNLRPVAELNQITPKEKRRNVVKKVGRPIADDKEQMLIAAVKWLGNNPLKSAPQAASYVYDVREAKHNWPEGYERPESKVRKAEDPFVRAINRARRKAISCEQDK